MDERVIELQELRIGNLLEYKGEIVYVSTLSMDIDDEYQETIGFVKYGESSNEHADWNRALCLDLKRIPLAPEWLERMGYRDGMLINFDKSIKLSVHDGFAYIGNSTSTSAAYISSVQYVHQLQNLYFALTGDELTIKGL